MLELYGWEVGMDLTAALLLIGGAVVIGVAAQLIGEVRIGFEWIFTAIAALVGGYLGSEAFGTLSTWGPVYEGLYVVPAIIGGVVLGVGVDAVTRYVTEGSYVHAPRQI
jgi:uncharacterized membrane protein YeaQ/YmgE (transglycosylase-associated protein family)